MRNRAVPSIRAFTPELAWLTGSIGSLLVWASQERIILHIASLGKGQNSKLKVVSTECVLLSDHREVANSEIRPSCARDYRYIGELRIRWRGGGWGLERHRWHPERDRSLEKKLKHLEKSWVK